MRYAVHEGGGGGGGEKYKYNHPNPSKIVNRPVLRV